MSTIWRSVKVGAGGYQTSMQVANDGTMASASDTYGAYILEPGHDIANQDYLWRQVCTFTGMSAFDPLSGYPDGNRGVNSLAIAKYNAAIMYLWYLGRIWKSVDTGLTWQIVLIQDGYADAANGEDRLCGHRLMVDPANPDVVYFGTRSVGVKRTFDGGANWELISTAVIPACSTSRSGAFPGHPGIAFDESGGTVNVSGVVRTANVFVPVWGTGCYRSTDGGQNWAALDALPSAANFRIWNGKVSSDGVYYVAREAGATQCLYRWQSGTWTDISPGNRSAQGIIPHPTTAGRVIAVHDSGSLRISNDYGATWSSFVNHTTGGMQFSSPDIPWLKYTRQSNMALGDAVIDPSDPDFVYISCGIGVARTEITTDTPTSFNWTWCCKGIENLTSSQVLMPPGQKPIALAWDRASFRIDDPEVYQTFDGPYQRFESSGVDVGANTITCTNHKLWGLLNVTIGTEGTGVTPGGLTNDTAYITHVTGPNTVKLIASAPIFHNITSGGTGTHTIVGRGITFTSSDIDTTANVEKFIIEDHGLWSDEAIQFSSDGTLPGGISASTDYYVIRKNADEFHLAGTSPLTAVDITSQGSGTHSFHYDQIRHGYAGDYASDDPATAFMVGNGTTVAAFYAWVTNDNGINWRPIDRVPGGGGNSGSKDTVLRITNSTSGLLTSNGGFFMATVACASATNWIWIPVAKQPYNTKDGGATWTERIMPGAPRVMTGDISSGSRNITNLSDDTSNLFVGASYTTMTGLAAGTVTQILSASSVEVSQTASQTLTGQTVPFTTGYQFSAFNRYKQVAADRVDIGTFYIFNSTTGHVYISTDGGDTWAQKSSSALENFAFAVNAPRLMTVPGQAGHLFFAPGNQGTVGATWPSGTRLYRSTDYGETWSRVLNNSVDNIREPYCVGFSAPAVGQSYPQVAFWGGLNGVFGCWRSIDNCVTWEKIGDFPEDWLEQVIDLQGSMDEAGTFYGTTATSSFVYRTEAMQLDLSPPLVRFHYRKH